MSFIVKTKAIVGALTITLCCIGLLCPSIAETAVFDVDEGWEEETVWFTVFNEYDDIQEFAIGNNTATYAGYWHRDWIPGVKPPTDILTVGTIATKTDGHWWVSNEGSPRYLTWMDEASNFDSFTKAFLFTSWEEGAEGYNGYLETGFTDGYFGDADEPASPFAGFSESEGTIIGDTEAVPLPGAVWLLGSGLLGLVGFKRKFKKA